MNVVNFKKMKKSSKQNDRQEQNNSIHGLLKKNTKFEAPHKCILNTFDYFILTTLALILLTNALSYFEEISWQLSSAGRLVMIKLLPYFNWKSLKNKYCLVNPVFSERTILDDELSCNLCEDIVGIDAHKYLEEEILEERYINLDTPVIITKHSENWPNNSKFIEKLMDDQSFSKSYPCNLATNIFKGSTEAGIVLSKQKYFDSFFIHFQNCEVEAMRALRKFVFTPIVLPSKYSPTLYNWIIWSKNYSTANFRPIALVEKVTVIGQLFGTNSFRLLPRVNCETVCSSLNFSLQEGEILIFTSLWDLEYRPGETAAENMAIVMEYRD